MKDQIISLYTILYTLQKLLVGCCAIVLLHERGIVLWQPTPHLNSPTALQAAVLYAVDMPLYLFALITWFRLVLDAQYQRAWIMYLKYIIPMGGLAWLIILVLSQLSVVWATYAILAQAATFHLLCGLVLAVSLSDHHLRQWALWGLIIGGTWQALIAMLQVLNGDVLGLAMLGEPRTLFESTGDLIRGYGLSKNPNQLAGYLLLCGAATHYQWQHTPHHRYLWISGAIIAVGLLVSGSRSAWLGLGIAIWWMRPSWRVGIMVAGGGVALYALLLGSTPIIDRFFFAYADTVTVIRDHGLLGVGAHHLMIAIGQDGIEGILLPAHNSFLIIWAELGFIGLISLVALQWQASRLPTEWNALLIAFGVILLFDFYLWQFWHMRLVLLMAWGLAWHQHTTPITKTDATFTTP